MAKTSGRFVKVYFAGYDLSGSSRQFDALIEFDEIDLTGFGDATKHSGPGFHKGTAALSTYFNSAARKSLDAFKAQVGSYTDKELLILLGANAAPVLGDPVFMMTSKEFTLAVPLEKYGVVIADANISAQQRAAWGSLLVDTTITNTATGSSIDNTYATGFNAQAMLQILTILASDTYVVKVQDSNNDSDWADLTSFSLDGSAIGSERDILAANTGIVNRSFEGGTTGWSAAGSDSDSIAQSVAQAFEGTNSLLLTSGTGTAHTNYAESALVTGAVQNDIIAVDVMVYVPTSWPDDFKIYVAEYTGGDAYISQQKVGASITTTGAWVRHRGHVKLAEGTAAKVRLRLGDPTAQNFGGGVVTAYIDKAQMVEASVDRHIRYQATRTGAGAQNLQLAVALDRGKEY